MAGFLDLYACTLESWSVVLSGIPVCVIERICDWLVIGAPI